MAKRASRLVLMGLCLVILLWLVVSAGSSALAPVCPSSAEGEGVEVPDTSVLLPATSNAWNCGFVPPWRTVSGLTQPRGQIDPHGDVNSMHLTCTGGGSVGDNRPSQGASPLPAGADAISDSSVLFIQNVGQFAAGARFQVWGADHTIWLAEDALWITVTERGEPQGLSQLRDMREEGSLPLGRTLPEEESCRAANLRLSFTGGNPHPRLESFGRLETHVSYFLGNDPAHWHADVPVWAGVRYVDLYPGIDLELTGEGGRLVQRLVARPGADLSAVRLQADGADALVLDGDWLRATTALGEVALPLLEVSGAATANDRSPVLDGKQISLPFAQSPSEASAQAMTSTSDLVYASFLGGSGYDWPSFPGPLAVDESGNAYVSGGAGSSDFPSTPGAFDTTWHGGFLAKVNPSGSALVYVTFLGGQGITVDGVGNAYVTGSTGSSNFPATPGAVDTSLNGSTDAFVLKLDPSGSALVYATFLGGSGSDEGRAIAVDGSGNAYVSGSTSSSDFPVTPGALDTSWNGSQDAFVARLDSSGSALAYATFLGGSSSDSPSAIAVDGAGNACVTGETESPDFPATPGALDPSFNGGPDAFLAKLDPVGSALLYATYLGGSNEDRLRAVALDGSGSAYVTGWTFSSDFPTTFGAFDTSRSGINDGFVAKLNPAGTALLYATLLGTSGYDLAFGMAVDGSGNAYVTGAAGAGFPTTAGAYDTSPNGDFDVFVVELNAEGSALLYATFLGGYSEDMGHGVALDAAGDVYVAGHTFSSDFPTTVGAFDTSFNGYEDCFVAKLAIPFHPATIPAQVSPWHGSVVPVGDVTFTWTPVAGASAYQVQTDRTAAFTSPELISATVSSTGYTCTPTLGTWYWRVRALPDGEWSATWQVHAAAPPVQVTTHTSGDYDPSMVQAADGRLWVVWYSSRSGNADLWYKTSSNGGETWSADTQLTTDTGWDYGPAVTQAADGTLWVVWYSYRSGNADLWYKTSGDGGATWSADTQLTTDPNGDYQPAVAQVTDGKLWVVWYSDRSGNGDIWYKTSGDGGATWSADTQLTTDSNYDYGPAITQADDGKLWVVWYSYRSGNADIWFKTSSDGGATWSTEARLTTSSDYDYSPSIVKATDGTLWLMWYRSINYGSQLWYQTSSDNGVTWSSGGQWTRFMGYNRYPDLAALSNGAVAVAWDSDRAVNYDIWFGILAGHEDMNPPPHIGAARHLPGPNPDNNDTVTVRAYVADEWAVQSVTLLWTRNDTAQTDVAMYDDGAHNDGSFADRWYGAQIGPFPTGEQIAYQVRAVDNDGNTVTAGSGSFTVLEPFSKTADILFVADEGPWFDTAWFRSYYAQAFDDGGWSYDLWDVFWRGAPDASVLNQYSDGAVVWASPSDWSACLFGFWDQCNLFDTARALRSYLDNGGNLFLSGQDIGEQLDGIAFLFMSPYLHAQYVQSNVGLYSVNGVADDPIGQDLALGISGGDGANNQSSPDEIDPIAPAVAVFTYDSAAVSPLVEPVRPQEALPEDNRILSLLEADGQLPPQPGRDPEMMSVRCAERPQAEGQLPEAEDTAHAAGIVSSGTAGLRVDTGTYKVVYFAFGFEGINSRAGRAIVMDRVLSWLGASRPAASLFFNPASRDTHHCGGPFTVDVEAGGVFNLGGFQFDLGFDPSTVHVQDIVLGGLITSSARTFTPHGPQINNTAGTATFGASSSGTELGPTGSGIIARITLSSVNTGTATLALQGICITNTSGMTLPVVAETGLVTVLPTVTGDMDCDCDVDIVDIMLVASRWNTRTGDPRYDLRYDLDQDGDIDIVDIMLVATRWNTRCSQAIMERAYPRTAKEGAPLPDAAFDSGTHIERPAQTTRAGEALTIAIEVEDVVQLGGFELTLEFAPSELQVEDVVLGSLLESTGRSGVPLPPLIDNRAGFVRFGAFSYGTAEGASGSGTLAHVVLRRVGRANGQLTISELQLTDTGGYLQTRTPGDQPALER